MVLLMSLSKGANFSFYFLDIQGMWMASPLLFAETWGSETRSPLEAFIMVG